VLLKAHGVEALPLWFELTAQRAIDLIAAIARPSHAIIVSVGPSCRYLDRRGR
jgi:hypothetical protein